MHFCKKCKMASDALYQLTTEPVCNVQFSLFYSLCCMAMTVDVDDILWPQMIDSVGNVLL